MRVRGAGVSVEAPAGWDVEIVERGAPPTGGASGEAVGAGLAILHGANFPLPPDRSDFGHEILGAMGMGEVFVALIEYGHGEADKALFSHEGIPTLDPDALSFDASMGVMSGQAASQYFFHVGTRAFCLYVAVGSFRLRARLLPLIEEFIGSLQLG